MGKAQEELEEAITELQIKEKMEERHTTKKTRRESEIAKNYLDAVIAQQALDAAASASAGIDMRLFRDLIYVGIFIYHESLVSGRQDRAKLQAWGETDEFIVIRDAASS